MDEAKVSLRPVTLTRRGARWTGRRIRSREAPTRPARSPRLILLRGRGRRDERRPGASLMALVSRRRSMLMQATHLQFRPHLAFRLYPGDRRVPHADRTRSEPAPRAATPSNQAPSLTRWTAIASPAAKAHGVERIVVRERLRIDTFRVSETALIVRGAAGPARVSGQNTHAPAPAATSPAARFATDDLQLEADTSPRVDDQSTAIRDPLARPSPASFAPDVEEITTQVLNRIERRAIAQRERMGRV